LKRIIIWSLTAGTMLSFSSILEAQEVREERGSREAFIDENVDGINDGMARMHRRGGERAGEARASILSAEQQSALEVLVGELKDGEATQEEIHAAVEGQFSEWGIELPEKPEGVASGGRGGQGEHVNPLTQEQRAAVDALVSDLRANEATPEEIRTAVAGQLADMGVELPERPEGRGEHAQFGKGPRSGSAEGKDESTFRRGGARVKIDNTGIESIMLQTQGLRAQ
jgi:hypothetical protein